MLGLLSRFYPSEISPCGMVPLVFWTGHLSPAQGPVSSVLPEDSNSSQHHRLAGTAGGMKAANQQVWSGKVNPQYPCGFKVKHTAPVGQKGAAEDNDPGKCHLRAIHAAVPWYDDGERR